MEGFAEKGGQGWQIGGAEAVGSGDCRCGGGDEFQCEFEVREGVCVAACGLWVLDIGGRVEGWGFRFPAAVREFPQ